ncbi:MAG: glycosyltransferase family 4 protein [Candidatus Paceibacterota bacterium]
MKLLIITQKVDKNDSVLGFFHGWIREFAEKFEKITVICLEKGKEELPESVKVFSLGKEVAKKTTDRKLIKFKVIKRLRYIFNFYKYIWKERKNYETVFVHMNEEYVLLGWWLWKLSGKRIFLWRNHPKGSLATRIVVFLSDNVFYTSPFSFTARFKKGILMPVGIDEDKFKVESRKFRKPEDRQKSFFKILYLGRIAPVKGIGTIIEAGKILKEKGTDFKLDIIGEALEKDKKYYENLKLRVEDSKLAGEIRFLPEISNLEASEVYANYDVFINATKTGSMDKTIFEAIFAELPVITSNQALKNFFGEEYAHLLLFKEEDSSDLALKIEKAREFLNSEGAGRMTKELRKKAEKEQSLKELGRKLSEILKREQ